jgi:hypothetical protein
MSPEQCFRGVPLGYANSGAKQTRLCRRARKDRKALRLAGLGPRQPTRKTASAPQALRRAGLGPRQPT